MHTLLRTIGPLVAALICLSASARGQNVVAWDGQGNYKQLGLPTGLYKAVSLESNGGLALKADGRVVAWQGTGTATPVAGLDDVKAIAAGSPNLALQTDGTADLNLQNPQTAHVVAIAGGGAHSMVLKSDGTVVVWGQNTYSQSAVPGELLAAQTAHVVAIAAGDRHSLALRSDGNVLPWGAWLPAGGTGLPAEIQNVVVAMDAGIGENIFLKGDGTIMQWPTAGQVGNNNVVAVDMLSLLKGNGRVVGLTGAGAGCCVPVKLNNVVAISGQTTHTLALGKSFSHCKFLSTIGAGRSAVYPHTKSRLCLWSGNLAGGTGNSGAGGS